MSLLKKLTSTIRMLEVLILLTLLPLILLGILFMIFIRFIILNLAKIFRKDLDCLVSGRSSGFALDAYYNFDRPTLPILVSAHLNGYLSQDTLKSQVLKILRIEQDNLRNSNSQQNQHHRLTQYVTSWVGVFFWKVDSSFQVQNHVRVVQLNQRTTFKDSLLELQKDLLIKPFKLNRSPWELFLMYNNKDNCNDSETVLLLRIHHVLGDGYSILKFLVNDLGDNQQLSRTSVPAAKIPRKCVPIVGRFLAALTFPFRAAYELVSILGEIGSQDLIGASKNGKVSEGEVNNLNHTFSEPIAWNVFKQIKESHDVTFTAIMLSSLARALRSLFLENDQSTLEHILCFVLLPFPNHAEEFSNHMTGCFIKIPLTNLSTMQRLVTIENEVQAVKKSTFPTVFFYLTEIIGLPFNFITKLFFGTALSTAVASNFLGPTNATCFQNISLQTCEFVAGFGPGNVAFAISSLSYNGNVRIGITANSSLLPRNITSVAIVEKIEEELQVLFRS